MSCLRPGPATVVTRITPGAPPIFWTPAPAPTLPLTSNCWVAGSHQHVALRASNSSVVRYAWARSHILGGSVMWASQSKVAKSLVMGANVWTGMLYLLSQLPCTHDSERKPLASTCREECQHEADCRFSRKQTPVSSPRALIIHLSLR